VRLWNLTSGGREQAQLTGHDGWVLAAAMRALSEGRVGYAP